MTLALPLALLRWQLRSLRLRTWASISAAYQLAASALRPLPLLLELSSRAPLKRRWR